MCVPVFRNSRNSVVRCVPDLGCMGVWDLTQIGILALPFGGSVTRAKFLNFMNRKMKMMTGPSTVRVRGDCECVAQANLVTSVVELRLEFRSPAPKEARLGSF